MKKRIIGIMGAMPEEIDAVKQLLEDSREVALGMRTYTTGILMGIPTVVVFSRWGKVAAAITVSTLILEFGISELIFTGVAGAVHPGLQPGDIVLGQRLVQHDMDARPLMPQFEIPLLGRTWFECRPEQLRIATVAIQGLLERTHLQQAIGREELEKFGIIAPKLMIGDIASGDKFFASVADKDVLLNGLPSALCVEMEGAAVAQVCYEYDLPFTIVRTISDSADDTSHIDFPAFIGSISSRYSLEIIRHIYEQWTI